MKWEINEGEEDITRCVQRQQVSELNQREEVRVVISK